MTGGDKIEGARWVKLMVGFAILFAVLQGSAAVSQSLRGEAGLIVMGVTLLAALPLQRLLFAPTWRDAFASLGLGATRWRGFVVAAALSAALLCTYPIYLAVFGGDLEILPNWAWLALGIFVQAGVAEEVVFRGYLYGHIRRGRTFWRAALLSMAPFSAAHLYLFFTMDWPIALTALLLSVAISFPFARLYDLGGRTIWAPALAHAIVQGAIKLFIVHDQLFLIVWMLASAGVMWLVFFVSSSADSRS